MSETNFNSLSKKAQAAVLACQKDEETGHLIYLAMAKREKNRDNWEILSRMASDEKTHAAVWKGISGQNVAPNKLKVWFFTILSMLLGFTFVLKRIQRDETDAIKVYAELKAELPEAERIQRDEMEHEKALIDMLDEERLQYVGAMVLGLNDALVELTGAIAGLSFALMNTRVVALSGIITGISATLSMAASNYLAERANGNPNAMKSSLYTGIAYVITVVLLVLPYLLLPENMYLLALIIMLCIVVLIIMVFNYYISVAKDHPFARRFGEMCAISLGVAAIAFAIGLLAKELLGVDVG